jgi:hypothetical protein
MNAKLWLHNLMESPGRTLNKYDEEEEWHLLECYAAWLL